MKNKVSTIKAVLDTRCKIQPNFPFDFKAENRSVPVVKPSGSKLTVILPAPNNTSYPTPGVLTVELSGSW